MHGGSEVGIVSRYRIKRDVVSDSDQSEATPQFGTTSYHDLELQLQD